MTTEQRIAKLERSNRWLCAGLAVLLGGTAIAALIAAATAPQEQSQTTDFLTVRKLLTVGDAAGKRILLEANENKASVVIKDASGDSRAMLSMRGDGVAFTLYDKKKQPRFQYLIADRSM